MSATLAVARFTIQEAVSRRLILAALVLGAAFVALYAIGVALIPGAVPTSPEVRGRGPGVEIIIGPLFTLMGLYSTWFLSSFVALFVAVGAVSGEIDGGTLSAVLARPIPRPLYVLGRWLGLLALSCGYVTIMALAIIGTSWLGLGYQLPSVPAVVGLLALSAASLTTLALAGSTAFSTLANGVAVFSLYAIAWIGGIIEYIGGLIRNDAMLAIGTVISLIVPTDALWRGASYFIQSPEFLASLGAGAGVLPFASNAPPTLLFVVWAALSLPTVLLLALLTFQRRDL